MITVDELIDNAIQYDDFYDDDFQSIMEDIMKNLDIEDDDLASQFWSGYDNEWSEATHDKRKELIVEYINFAKLINEI